MTGVLTQQLRGLGHRLRALVSRFVLGSVDDGGGVQLVRGSLLAGEEVAEAEHLQPYGLTYVPLAGAEAVALFPAGDRSHPLIVAIGDRRHRLSGLGPGEVALYTHEDGPGGGHRIVLRADRTIEITGRDIRIAATERLTLDCGGNGLDLTPATRTDYVAGAAVTTTALHPPAIRED